MAETIEFSNNFEGITIYLRAIQELLDVQNGMNLSDVDGDIFNYPYVAIDSIYRIGVPTGGCKDNDMRPYALLHHDTNNALFFPKWDDCDDALRYALIVRLIQSYLLKITELSAELVHQDAEKYADCISISVLCEMAQKSMNQYEMSMAL